jgi:hypothetical protein
MTPRQCILAILVTGSMLSACGVPTQDEPHVVERNDVPFGLVQDHPPRPSTPESSQSR